MREKEKDAEIAAIVSKHTVCKRTVGQTRGSMSRMEPHHLLAARVVSSFHSRECVVVCDALTLSESVEEEALPALTSMTSRSVSAALRTLEKCHIAMAHICGTTNTCCWSINKLLSSTLRGVLDVMQASLLSKEASCKCSSCSLEYSVIADEYCTACGGQLCSSLEPFIAAECAREIAYFKRICSVECD